MSEGARRGRRRGQSVREPEKCDAASEPDLLLVPPHHLVDERSACRCCRAGSKRAGSCEGAFHKKEGGEGLMNSYSADPSPPTMTAEGILCSDDVYVERESERCKG